MSEEENINEEKEEELSPAMCFFLFCILAAVTVFIFRDPVIIKFSFQYGYGMLWLANPFVSIEFAGAFVGAIADVIFGLDNVSAIFGLILTIFAIVMGLGMIPFVLVPMLIN